MRHYETIFIIKPNLSEDDYKTIVQKYIGLVEKAKGIMIKTDLWGVQRLAYSIAKEERGFFVLLDFCASAGGTAELERDLNLNDRILKYQTIKVADKANPEELLQKEQDKIAKKAQPGASENPSQNEESGRGKEVRHGN